MLNEPSIHHCAFFGNLGDEGGGIYVDDVFPVIANCLFSGNEATLDEGGGILISLTGNFPDGSLPEIRIENCTLSQNISENIAGGIDITLPGDSRFNGIITNTISWLNNGSSAFEDQYQASGGTITRRYCCMNGLSAGGTNISTDPRFLDPDGLDDDYGTDDDDLHLDDDPLSPCIDTGNNSDVNSGSDLDGNARVQDGPGPGGVVVDRGCYEVEED